jgi:hypothetical protein
MIYSFIDEKRSGPLDPGDPVIKRLWEFKKNLLIWGGPNMIKAMMDFEKGASEEATVLANVENLIRATREELGHDDSKLPTGSLIAMLLNERHKILKS